MIIEAFTYVWVDNKNKMYYVGWHKGQIDDGYVCSSKWMLEEYNKRPADFTRQIIATGSSDFCHHLETTILKEKDAAHNPSYYNMCNNTPTFVNKHQTEESKEKSRIILKEAMKGNKNSEGHRHTEETRNKIRVALTGIVRKQSTKDKLRILNTGENNPRYGQHHLEKTKAQISDSHKGMKHTEETLQKMRINHKGTSGMIWITNGLKRLLVSKDQQIPEGFRKGRILKAKPHAI